MKNGDTPVSGSTNNHDGLTKREYFAGLAMQGLLASGPHDCDLRGIAYDAVCAADALLKALEES
jgi:hypothetical protein